jgi:exopolysaccharide biosynthesis predicted pyruvyltransferase EpsI
VVFSPPSLGDRRACHDLLVPHPDSTLLRSLNTAIDDGLRAVLGDARRVSLVHFPDTDSPGDAAGWLGTRIALRRLGVRVAYQCLAETLCADAVDGPLLVAGDVDVDLPAVRLADLKAPDLSLALGALPRLGHVEADVLWLCATPGTVDGVSNRAVEWGSPEPDYTPRQRVAAKANWELRGRAVRDPDFARRTWRGLSATFVPLAKGHVRHALTVLGAGRVVVTDDPCGHLLALLAGIPHIVLGDLVGAVTESSLVRTADDPDAAGPLALELLDSAP